MVVVDIDTAIFDADEIAAINEVSQRYGRIYRALAFESGAILSVVPSVSEDGTHFIGSVDVKSFANSVILEPKIGTVKPPHRNDRSYLKRKKGRQ